jgi:hypothetical protein
MGNAFISWEAVRQSELCMTLPWWSHGSGYSTLTSLEILCFLLRQRAMQGGFPRGFVRWVLFEWPSFASRWWRWSLSPLPLTCLGEDGLNRLFGIWGEGKILEIIFHQVGFHGLFLWSSLYSLGTYCTENTAWNKPSIVVWRVKRSRLPSDGSRVCCCGRIFIGRCVTTAVFSGFMSHDGLDRCDQDISLHRISDRWKKWNISHVLQCINMA